MRGKLLNREQLRSFAGTFIKPAVFSLASLTASAFAILPHVSERISFVALNTTQSANPEIAHFFNQAYAGLNDSGDGNQVLVQSALCGAVGLLSAWAAFQSWASLPSRFFMRGVAANFDEQLSRLFEAGSNYALRSAIVDTASVRLVELAQDAANELELSYRKPTHQAWRWVRATLAKRVMRLEAPINVTVFGEAIQKAAPHLVSPELRDGIEHNKYLIAVEEELNHRRQVMAQERERAMRAAQAMSPKS